MEKKFKTLHTKERTFDIITFLAKAQNISKVAVLENVFDALFDAGSNIPKNARMLIDVTGNQAVFTFAGRPVVTSGTFHVATELPEPEVDSLVAEKVEKQIEDEKNGK